jgi:hypothetical protein
MLSVICHFQVSPFRLVLSSWLAFTSSLVYITITVVIKEGQVCTSKNILYEQPLVICETFFSLSKSSECEKNFWHLSDIHIKQK